MVKKALLLLAVLCIGGAAGAGAQDYTVLHNFADNTATNGEDPYGALVSDGSTLYGMTYNGGANDNGTVFSIGVGGGGFTLLHSFKSSDVNNGGAPYGSLILLGSTLYGMTYYGGANNNGTVFSIGVGGGGFTLLHSFKSSDVNNGAYPYDSLIADGSTLYGMTYEGGANGYGTVFSIGTNGSAFTLLHSFKSSDVNNGAYPYGSLIAAGSTLYGMTYKGGANDDGTVFSIGTDGGGFTLLHSFDASDPGNGASPYYNSTLLSNDSTLYGVTYYGGANGDGTLFSIGKDGSGFTLLHSFAENNPANGTYGMGSLVSDGSTLYGMTYYGGTGPYSGGDGTVFSIMPDGTGFTILHSFGGPPGDAAWPEGNSLLLDDWVLYGMTRWGGSDIATSEYGQGAIFSYALPTPTPTPNYVNLTASPSSVSQGGSVSMGWSCDFTTWNYQGVPVNIYVAAINDPKVADAPSSTADALAGGQVWLAADGMTSWYRYTGSVGAPTWSGVAFPPAPTSGTKALPVPNNPMLAGDWVFATAFVRADGGGFVRTDGKPVENSNVFSIQ